MKVLHDWIKEYTGASTPSPKEIDDLLTFHAFEVEAIEEVGESAVIDVKVLPDRSSDCLSHRGIARELATLLATPLVNDPLSTQVTLLPITEKLHVTIEDTKKCRRFTGALIDGVTIKESPAWLKVRLLALGQRSINNVVDATNYVMLGLGQPLHAYDADKFPHDERGWHIGVRMAREGEEVVTLTGETHILTPKVQLIVEGEKDIPVGIAGIKGGKYAEIHGGTTSLIIEAANFDPQVTRIASQSIKLQTDASKRFENNLSPHLAAYGLKEVVALILDIAGGKLEGYMDVFPDPVVNGKVVVTHTHIQALLGLELTKEAIEGIFARLGFLYETNEGGWVVTAPFERTDVLIAEDVIAEVGRVYGYDHISSVVPETVPLLEINSRHYYSEQIRDILAEQGFSEVITSSFRKKDQIQLANALASDKGYLRSSLKENIKEALDRNMPNADLLKVRSLKLFEIGTVFQKNPEGKGVLEHTELAIGVRVKQGGASAKDDGELKTVLDLMESKLGAALGGVIDSGVLIINLSKIIPALEVPSAYDTFRGASELTYAPFSSYPFVSRDIALWCEEGVTAVDVEAIMKTEGGELLLHSTLFDEFHKDGKVSYAFRLVFQSFERTLTDVEVGEIMEKITVALQNKGYSVR